MYRATYQHVLLIASIAASHPVLPPSGPPPPQSSGRARIVGEEGQAVERRVQRAQPLGRLHLSGQHVLAPDALAVQLLQLLVLDDRDARPCVQI